MNKGLTELSLNGNSMGLKGCSMLIDALHSSASNIAKLDLARNQILFAHEHALELIVDPSDVHTCDLCSSAGMQPVHRCDVCDFDLCPSCFSVTCPFVMVAKAVSMPTLTALDVSGNGFVSSALGTGHAEGMQVLVDTLKDSGMQKLHWSSAQHPIMVQDLLSSEEVALDHAPEGSDVKLIACLIHVGMRKMKFLAQQPCDCGNSWCDGLEYCGGQGPSEKTIALNFNSSIVCSQYDVALGSTGFILLTGVLQKFKSVRNQPSYSMRHIVTISSCDLGAAHKSEHLVLFTKSPDTK